MHTFSADYVHFLCNFENLPSVVTDQLDTDPPEVKDKEKIPKR